MLARDESMGSGSGLHSALLQDSIQAQGKPDNTVYDHAHPAFQRKQERASFGDVPWPRGVTGADPLFPEPETAASKAFNGGAARWGSNDGEVKRPWAGGRPARGAVEQEPRRAPAPAVNGARRWDDTRPQERNNSWNGEPRQAAREPRETDAPWRAGGVAGAARFAQPKNDNLWRKAGDLPGPAIKPNETRREGPAGQGLAAAPSFAAAHGLVPGARAPAGVRPATTYGARMPAGLKKYRKEELLGVLASMKQQVGEQLPLPEGSNLEDDVKELWRGDAGWHAAHWHGGAHVEAASGAPPPGLDPYIQKLHTISPQLSHLGIPSPLQVLKMGTYFYKDPQGLVHGPFTSENLKSWNTQGYLYPELECTDSADSQTFFPFSSLSELWSLQEKLGLKPEDVQKLADAEVRLAKQAAAPPPAPAVPVYQPVHQPEAADQHQHVPFTGAHQMGATATHRPAPVVDNQLAAATDGGWDAPPLHQQPGSRGNQPQRPQGHPSLAAPKQHASVIDPIDAIIDEGPRQVVTVAPGERTLQPFTGMGMGAAPVAAPPAAPQYAARDVGPMGTQQAQRAIPDAVENLHISSTPASPPPVGSTKVAPMALFGEPKPVQSVVQSAAPKSNHVADPVSAQRIVPAQLFAQFSNARDAQGPANGHAPTDTMAMQQPLMQPPAPPPRAPAAPQAATASRPMWGAAQPVQPAKFDEIQAEEIRKRKQEDAAAQVAAKSQMAQVEAERARRAAWAAQPKPVNFRQVIEDDEECAADLEGGCFEGELDEYVEQAAGYNPWQGQEALPADGRSHASAAQHGADVYRGGVVEAAAAPAVPPPPAPYSRTAAQVLGQDSRAVGVQHAPKRAPAANTAKLAWQANTGRPAEQVAPPPPPPAAELLQEPEPEILKNNPDFYEWCMQEMKHLRGDMNVLVVLLETGANCEIMDFARSNLKGGNIGAFVSEFIKRKAHAAASKPAGRKRKGKGATGATNAAVAPQAAPARGGPAAETVGDGWEAVGAKGKPKRKGGAVAQPGVRLGGGAFAVLPSS